MSYFYSIKNIFLQTFPHYHYNLMMKPHKYVIPRINISLFSLIKYTVGKFILKKLLYILIVCLSILYRKTAIPYL